MAKNFRYKRSCRVPSKIAAYVYLIVYVSINDHLEKSSSITHNYKNTIEINALYIKRRRHLFRLFLFFTVLIFLLHHFCHISSSSIVYFLVPFFNKTFKNFLHLVLHLPFSSMFKNLFLAFWSLLNILVPQPNRSPSISIYLHHLFLTIPIYLPYKKI